MKAVDWMRQGKKVRLGIWIQGRFIRSDDGFIKSNNGEIYSFSLNQFQNANWEVFEENCDVKYMQTVCDQLKELQAKLDELKKGH